MTTHDRAGTRTPRRPDCQEPPPTFGPNVPQGRTQSREPTLTAHPPSGGLRGGPPAGDV